MPLILLYLVKLSLSLAVVYLFYHSVLRRLTFYNWNRFYLLCCTILSFLIPLVNITPLLARSEMADSRLIRFIPVVGNLKNNIPAIIPAKETLQSWTAWEGLLMAIITGIAIMLIRLGIQLISLKKMANNAQLVSSDDIKLYQVDRPIIPFSFGNSIFINRDLHPVDELSEIIRHEFVHVKQRHTRDIIGSELLCALNWYNPFAWMIRKAIRQNLEFIADSMVLQTGIDKKQ